MTDYAVTPTTLCSEVTKTVKDPNFVEFNKTSGAPLAMIAFAKAVVEKIILDKQITIESHFTGLTMTVPSNQNSMDPH